LRLDFPGVGIIRGGHRTQTVAQTRRAGPK